MNRSATFLGFALLLSAARLHGKEPGVDVSSAQARCRQTASAASILRDLAKGTASQSGMPDVSAAALHLQLCRSWSGGMPACSALGALRDESNELQSTRCRHFRHEGEFIRSFLKSSPDTTSACVRFLDSEWADNPGEFTRDGIDRFCAAVPGVRSPEPFCSQVGPISAHVDPAAWRAKCALVVRSFLGDDELCLRLEKHGKTQLDLELDAPLCREFAALRDALERTAAVRCGSSAFCAWATGRSFNCGPYEERLKSAYCARPATDARAP
jgi:hypothetical protein